MSRSGRPADVGGRETAEALRDPNVTQLMHVCGEHIDLVFDAAIQTICTVDTIPALLRKHNTEQSLNKERIWRRTLEREIRSRYADCSCSPFGRLVRRNFVMSGSTAEGLYAPGRPPKHQTTSDLDIMVEIDDAVHWTFPSTEETSPVEDTAAGPATVTTANTGGQDSDPTPRLVIEETENPGFVLVLQERRDDCPHQERRPFKAGDIIQFFRDCQMVTSGKDITQHSTNGPACSFVRRGSAVGGVSEYDEVPCLHVPVWWLTDEFFTRHRRYNWPPKAMRDDIRRFGLHLVPVGAPGSSTEKLQWRLSFSRAEVVVASDLTSLQRCAAIAFKLCKTALGEDGKVIKSYFIKTALFWLCEQTPTEDWKSVTQGLLKLLDYLEHAVSTGYLPCFFWSRINLLRFTSGAEREAMKKALDAIRKNCIRLLAHEVCVYRPLLQEMLTQQTGQLSECQLRVCLTRWLVVVGISHSTRAHMAISGSQLKNEFELLLPQAHAQEEVTSLLYSYSPLHHLQKRLHLALSMAPAEVSALVPSSGDDMVHVRDAAPLIELLTEDDLKVLLGQPVAVRLWLGMHHLGLHQLGLHQLEPHQAERPAATLPADLRSTRDLCDLLLNIPLLSWVLGQSVPDKCEEYYAVASHLAAAVHPSASSAEQERETQLQRSAHWRDLAVRFQTRLGMDHQTALRMACRVGVELRQLCDDPQALAEHNRICDTLQDPWQLKHFMLRGSH